LESTEALQKELLTFYKTLFDDPDENEDEGALPTWIWAAWPDEALKTVIPIDCDLVKSAVSRFKKNESCSSFDRVWAELLLALDDEIYDYIAAALRERIIKNHATPNPWEKVLVTLIEKTAVPTTVRDLRPITVFPCLLQLFSGVLQICATPKLHLKSNAQHAFRPGFQAEEVMFCIRTCVEAANGWNFPIFVLGGDVRKAYDYVNHTKLISALQKHGFLNPSSRLGLASLYPLPRRSRIIRKRSRTFSTVPGASYKGTQPHRRFSTSSWMTPFANWNLGPTRRASVSRSKKDTTSPSYPLQTISVY
jgi:hypothetical protein